MTNSYNTFLSIEQELLSKQFSSRNVRVFVKRDDLIDKEVSGNKWRKLKYNIEVALLHQQLGILTFGGAYSNHLLATASACNKVKIKSIGIVRGEELNGSSNRLLARCEQLGMKLIFVSRDKYDERNEKWAVEEYKENFPGFLIVPEGGANFHGLIGCQEMVKELSFIPDHLFLAQGTSTTSSGILIGIQPQTSLHVVPVLKGFNSLSEMKKSLYSMMLDQTYQEELFNQVVVHDSYHFGGYAKKTEELELFTEQIFTEFGLNLDLVYTAKAFFAMMEFIKKTVDFKNQTVLFIHTGGVFKHL